jgi:hypothetical protein
VSFDYALTAETVERLLTRFGASTTHKIKSTAVYDPATGSAAVSYTNQTVKAAVFAYEQKYIDGTLIKAGDQQALMSAQGVTNPKAGDLLTWGGVDLVVVAAKPLAPAGTDVLHELQIRKA